MSRTLAYLALGSAILSGCGEAGGCLKVIRRVEVYADTNAAEPRILGHLEPGTYRYTRVVYEKDNAWQEIELGEDRLGYLNPLPSHVKVVPCPVK
jgi:hypothetical protein